MKTQRILVPLDGSEMSHIALAEADTLACESGGHLTLMFVHAPATVHLMDEDFPEPEELTKELLLKARKIMEKWASSLETPEENYTIVIECCCKPSDAILKYSKNYDLIVMSTHGLTGLKHIMIGSVAERVIRSSHCDVLVIKKKSAFE